jgi:hypothetical protein
MKLLGGGPSRNCSVGRSFRYYTCRAERPSFFAPPHGTEAQEFVPLPGGERSTGSTPQTAEAPMMPVLPGR